jgi:diacylglycerol kinase (ATP)
MKKTLTLLYKAWTYARDGLIKGFQSERAIRQEIISFIPGALIIFLLPLNPIYQYAIISSLLIILIVECLNTAIEKTVDYISIDRHPEAKFIKDLGAAAVLLSFLHLGFWCLCAIQSLL